MEEASRNIEIVLKQLRKIEMVRMLSLYLSLQDGGLLTNNPCAAALHEARLLWGKTVPIQCVISLGTGLYCQRRKEGGRDKKGLGSTSLRDKLTKIVASATDTEGKAILRAVLKTP